MSKSSVSDVENERTALLRQAGDAVVALSDGRSRVAGIAWRADLAVAPAEALARSDEVQVTGTLGRAVGQVVAIDLAVDVGLVRCQSVWGRPAAPSGASLSAGVNVALLSREDSDLAVDWRCVRKAGTAWRSRRGGVIDQRIEIETGTPVPLEGSAIVAADGGIAGMAVHGPRRLLLGIPMATIERTVAEFEAHGRLRRGYLGISVLPLPLSRDVSLRWQLSSPAALIVADVAQGSPAATAGMDIGDLLVSANEAHLDRPEALTAVIRDSAPGDVLRLRLRRGGRLEELAVALGERPAH